MAVCIGNRQVDVAVVEQSGCYFEKNTGSMQTTKIKIRKKTIFEPPLFPWLLARAPPILKVKLCYYFFVLLIVVIVELSVLVMPALTWHASEECSEYLFKLILLVIALTILSLWPVLRLSILFRTVAIITCFFFRVDQS